MWKRLGRSFARIFRTYSFRSFTINYKKEWPRSLMVKTGLRLWPLARFAALTSSSLSSSSDTSSSELFLRSTSVLRLTATFSLVSGNCDGCCLGVVVIVDCSKVTFGVVGDKSSSSDTLKLLINSEAILWIFFLGLREASAAFLVTVLAVVVTGAFFLAIELGRFEIVF